MSYVQFKAGGALTDEHADVYVNRTADNKAIAHLRRMEYLLIVEPRQQGKTSLVNYLMCSPLLESFTFAYIDVTTPGRSTVEKWYQMLCSRILRQLRDIIPRDRWPTIPHSSTGWRDFLWEVATSAANEQRRVVIVLDEIGAVSFPGATEFFSVLRDVYNSRQAEMEFRQLTFLLVGAFHPRDLIKDDKISPFNVAKRVRLRDFDRQNVNGLVKHLLLNYLESSSENLPQDEFVGRVKAISERITYWVDGQPYLTQWICDYLTRFGPTVAPDHVDEAVEQLRREDDNHFPPILERLKADERLLDYVKRVSARERIKFYPHEHRRQAQLELLGVIKANPEGYCVVRNRLYEGILVPGDPLKGASKIELEANPPSSELPTIWKRLVVTNQTDRELTGCSARVLSVELLDRATDQAGQRIPEFESGWLSWAPGQFRQISIPPGQSETLDLIWWRHSPQGEPEPCLRVASSSCLGTTRQPGETDLVEIRKSGWHLIQITIEATELEPIERSYLLFWNGPQSNTLHVEERQLPEQSHPPVAPSPEPKTHTTHPDLADALTRRTLALFIGADLFREVTGLPSRSDLARNLARRKGLDESLSLAEVAQRVSQAGNRWEFTDFIRNALDTTGKSPQPFHRRIVELVKEHRVETLITTAYDNLLELAFQQAGVGPNRVVRGSDVSFIAPDRPTLIKLYGDAQQPDSLVVTDRDHSDLLRDREREALLDEVRRVFRRNTVLFLGYNLADLDFRFLFDQIAESRFARTAYAVWPGLPEADVRMWRDRGIVILEIDPLGILGEVGLPPVPPRCPELTVTPPISQSSIGGKDMDFERGLDAFKRLAEGTDWYQDFTVHEAPLRENLRDERRYGPSEQTRRDRTRIVDQLNALALQRLGISFNDLCLGKQPAPRTQPVAEDDSEIIERLHRIEAKLDQGRAEDRQAATQILDAITHNQVEQAEATQMVAELRAWAQNVQQAGLPLNQELRTAVDSLSQHTGSAYQYLQLAIPIIPGILSYNVELGSQHQLGLKTLWERIKARLGGSRQSSSLAGALTIAMDHDGQPHKAGPAQWWVRLKVESKESIRGLRGRVYDIRRLADQSDQYGMSLPEFHDSTLSWGSRENGLFAPISVQAGDVDYLDLAWRAHGDPPIPADELRVASALDQGPRDTTLPVWGMRQDFIPLKPGVYRLVVRMLAEEYGTPLDLAYRLDWSGPGREDDIRLTEMPSVNSEQARKGDGALPTGPEPLYGVGNHWAVLVGVNQYDDKTNYGPLQVCVKDVHALRDQLVDGGFEPARIRLLTDDTSEPPTRDNVLVALKAVADATEQDDLLLFYYSGHGDEGGGESYLVARNGRRLVLGDTAVRLSRVKEIVEGAPARAKVIILDACHSGANIGGKGPKPMSEEFIRRVFEQAEGLVILASCKQGQLSYEWRENERSVFTHFFLEALAGAADRDEKGFVTVQDTSRHVTNGVKLWASQRNTSQIPTLQYTVAGDIILVRYQ